MRRDKESMARHMHLSTAVTMGDKKGLWKGDAMKKVRVWIVEDNEPDIFLMQLALEKTSIPVDTTVVRSGEEALRFLGECNDGTRDCPDLLFLDFHLPQVSGPQLLGSILGSEALEKTRVVVFSSMPTPPAVQGVDWNVFHYVQKPTSLESFQTRVLAQVKLAYGEEGGAC